MPYTVKKTGDEWCVIKDDDGKEMGCHASEDEAKEQVAALYASEEKAQTWKGIDAEIRPGWAAGTNKAQADAEWQELFGDKDEPPPDDEDEPEPDEPVADPEAEEVTQEVATVEVPSSIRKLIVNLPGAVAEAVVKALTGRKEADDMATGLKVAGNHFFCVWSNNFEDRDGEIFTAKAIDDYVSRVDMGIVPPPELWVYHVPGTRIGQAEWVGRHGHFLTAFGTFDDTPAAQKARDHYASQVGKKKMSHGYKYAVGAGFAGGDFDGKHYHKFNTFEISLLPRGAEANMFTSLEGVKAMMKEISEAKKAELTRVFGDDAPAILATLETKGKALEELGVAFKDFTGEDVDASADKEAVDRATKSVSDMLLQVLEDGAVPIEAATAALKGQKATNATVAELRKEVSLLRQRVKEISEGIPRASEVDATLLDTESAEGMALKEKIDEQMKQVDGFWGTEVIKTP